MEGGLIEEGKECMEEDGPELIDLGIIAAAQRVEHYEISGTAPPEHWPSVSDIGASSPLSGNA